MKLRLLAAALAAAALAGAAQATVVTFDDLVGTGVLADGYGGIIWHGDWGHAEFVQFPYTPNSGTQRAYNSFDSVPGAFNFAAPVVFNGAWVSGGPEIPVQFELSLGGSVVHTSPSLAPTHVPAFLTSGYGGLVDQVTVLVLSPHGERYVIDDVTYNAGIPEPGAWALMIAGFGLTGAMLRARRTRRAPAAAGVRKVTLTPFR